MAIKLTLQGLRDTKVPLTTNSCRAIIIAHINRDVPELFIRKSKDGSIFRASKPWVRRFLEKEMLWSIRAATRAAQHTPENAEELVYRSALRQAMSIRNHHIPASLRVNSDQTQLVLQGGADVTWNEKGAKQVTTHTAW